MAQEEPTHPLWRAQVPPMDKSNILADLVKFYESCMKPRAYVPPLVGPFPLSVYEENRDEIMRFMYGPREDAKWTA